MEIYTKYLKNTLETYNHEHYDKSGIYKVSYTDKEVNYQDEYILVLKNLQLVLGIGFVDYIDNDKFENDFKEICKLIEENKINEYEQKLKEKEQEIIKLKEEYDKKEKEYNENINELKIKNRQLQEENIKLLKENKNLISSDILLKTIALNKLDDNNKLIEFIKGGEK